MIQLCPLAWGIYGAGPGGEDGCSQAGRSSVAAQNAAPAPATSQ